MAWQISWQFYDQVVNSLKPNLNSQKNKRSWKLASSKKLFLALVFVRIPRRSQFRTPGHPCPRSKMKRNGKNSLLCYLATTCTSTKKRRAWFLIIPCISWTSIYRIINKAKRSRFMKIVEVAEFLVSSHSANLALISIGRETKFLIYQVL